MFAIGLYDKQKNTLTILRDRVGKKPLYYTHDHNNFAFASELKSLKNLPWVKNHINPNAFNAYLRFSYVPGPASIIQRINKLEPGTLLIWNKNTGDIKKQPFWSLNEAIKRGKNNILTCSLTEAAEQLEALLIKSIQVRLRSDVPLGVFLSGGIDSTIVAAIAQSLNNNPLKTFTIGFNEQSHDESFFAKNIASYLGTEHHSLYLTENQATKLIPSVIQQFDEPFADNSCVPTFLLSEFSKKLVTVVLSGDGGDELFGGYPRYFWGNRILNLQKYLGNFGIKSLSLLLQMLPNSTLNLLYKTFLGSNANKTGLTLNERLQRFILYLQCTPDEVYRKLISTWEITDNITSIQATEWLGANCSEFSDYTWAEQMMAIDQKYYLVDDILTKIDRTTMAVSLEARTPMLDYRIVEWSWQLPNKFRFALFQDKGKILLRKVLNNYVPNNLWERPKIGFGMPLDQWLRRGQLKDWAEFLIEDDNLKKSGVFEKDMVKKIWKEHLSGINNLSKIWSILTFQEWWLSWQKQEL